jgi:hypothetical protein
MVNLYTTIATVNDRVSIHEISLYRLLFLGFFLNTPSLFTIPVLPQTLLRMSNIPNKQFNLTKSKGFAQDLQKNIVMYELYN